MTKYYEGSIFLNYYFDGCAGLVGKTLAAVLYDYLKLRNAFFLSVSIALVGLVTLLIFQEFYIATGAIC